MSGQPKCGPKNSWDEVRGIASSLGAKAPRCWSGKFSDHQADKGCQEWRLGAFQNGDRPMLVGEEEPEEKREPEESDHQPEDNLDLK